MLRLPGSRRPPDPAARGVAGLPARRAAGPPALGALAAALALVVALPACPGRPARSPERPRGGAVTVAYPHEPATLDPFAPGGDAPATRDLIRLLMPALYRIGPRGERSRWLLAREPVPEPGPPFSVALDLVAGARWSDGRPITSGDIRFTWKAALARGSVARDGYERIADIVEESPSRARLVFGEPFRRWRDLFSAGLGILPEHALSGKDLSRVLGGSWPVSGGPFVLVRRRAGLDMLFERNPRAPRGGSGLDRLRVVFVPDFTTALDLFRRGEVDALAGYQAVDAASRAERAGARVSSDIGATEAALVLAARSGPLADVRVRRALVSSFDRARISTGLVREEGRRLDTPLAGDPVLSTPVFPPKDDLSRARRLLAAAGWRASGTAGAGARRRRGKPLRVTLAFVASDDLPGVVARALRRQASLAGFDLVLLPMEPGFLWRSWVGGGRLEAALLVWRDPPGGSLRARFSSGGSLNVSGLGDPRLDAALGRMDSAVSDAEARRAASEAQRRMGDLAPVVPLYDARVMVAARAGVGGIRASAGADGPLWNAGEWWVTPSATRRTASARGAAPVVGIL
ncbi:MAG: hypothetical protein HY775_09225 [Acidobacteria bacterium]|nr:hypothetical protein [Acidobacteriota bacterium]